MSSGNRNGVRKGRDDGDLLGYGRGNSASDFLLHVHDHDNRRPVAGDYVSGKHHGEREFAWSGIGDCDVHDADAYGQLHAAADRCVRACIRVELPGGDDDGDVHGYGFVDEYKRMHVHGDGEPAVLADLSGEHHDQHGAESVHGSSDLLSADGVGFVRNSDVRSGIGEHV